MADSDIQTGAIKRAVRSTVEELKLGSKRIRDVPEAEQIRLPNSITEAPSGMDHYPKAIPFVVYPAMALFSIGYLALMLRCVWVDVPGWAHVVLLGLHVAGLITFINSYLGRSTKLGTLSSAGTKKLDA